MIIYVDVDDTLVRSFGSKQIAMSATQDYVRKLKKAGASLYCWSSGGADTPETMQRRPAWQTAF